MFALSLFEGVEALNSFSLITSHKFSVRRFSRFVFVDEKNEIGETSENKKLLKGLMAE